MTALSNGITLPAEWPSRTERAFIGARREPGSWEFGYVESTGGVLLVGGDGLWFYYSASAVGDFFATELDRHLQGQEAPPFLIVQLPGFHKHDEQAPRHALDMPPEFLEQLQRESTPHGFVEVREGLRWVRENVPQTGLAVTIDLGDPHDIHPPRKKQVGQRLARLARQLSYEETNLVAEDPLPEAVRFSGGSARVSFRNAGSGWKAASGDVAGFELAGADGGFVSATARAENATVLLTAHAVRQPQAVGSGWAGFPHCDLVNSAGLPASPFCWKDAGPSSTITTGVDRNRLPDERKP
jgi:sialate O-acetylesterase